MRDGGREGGQVEGGMSAIVHAHRMHVVSRVSVWVSVCAFVLPPFPLSDSLLPWICQAPPPKVGRSWDCFES